MLWWWTASPCRLLADWFYCLGSTLRHRGCGRVFLDEDSHPSIIASLRTVQSWTRNFVLLSESRRLCWELAVAYMGNDCEGRFLRGISSVLTNWRCRTSLQVLTGPLVQALHCQQEKAESPEACFKLSSLPMHSTSKKSARGRWLP